jgi:DnaK suppressor protein
MPAAKKATATTAKAKAKATSEKATDKAATGRNAPAARPEPPPSSHPVPSDKWMAKQQQALYAARTERLAEAEALKAEADQLALDAEPGDTQFDDESGEGSTTAVDRERDLALSAQARAEVVEIDVALDKIDEGSYGICDRCGKNIPKARLEVIPWAALCVSCKSGGLSARR